MPFPTINDSQIDVDSPFDEAVAGDLATRDTYVKTGNLSGNADVGENKYQSGHGHTGGADGPILDDTAIDTGGIWQSSYIGAGAVDTAEIQGSAVGYTQLAAGSVGTTQLSGDATNGIGEGPFQGTVTYPTEYEDVPHTLGRVPVVANSLDHKAVVLSTSDTTVRVGRNIFHAPWPEDWSYHFYLL